MLSTEESLVLSALDQDDQSEIYEICKDVSASYPKRLWLRQARRRLRAHYRSKPGIDPFTIAMLVFQAIRLCIELWRLWKKWNEDDDAEATYYLNTLNRGE